MAEKTREVTSVLLITTSHNPSHFLRRVCKLLSFSLPNSKRINRGSLSIKEIRNFCWNAGIQKVLIVQGVRKTDSVSLCCHNFSKSPHQVDVQIRLTNFHFPQKGNKETRVEGNRISVEFSPDTPGSIKDSIEDFMTPLLDATKSKLSNSNFLIRFSNYANGKLEGEVLRTQKTNVSPLYSFEVNMTKEVV